MRSLVVILALLATFPAAAKPDDDRIKLAAPPSWAAISEPLPVPDDARGAVFMRRQNIEVHLSKTSQTVFTAMLLRLIHPNALNLGNVQLSWNPAAGKPVVHAVKVHRDGTVRDVLATTQFEILQREDQLEAAKLDGVQTAVLRVPDLRVGDELELSYSVPAHDPTMGEDSYGVLFLAPIPPPGRFALRLSWDEGQAPSLKQTADLAPLIARGDRAVTIAADMPAPLNPPKDAPPRFSWQRILEYSDFASWAAVSSRIAPLFAKAATLPPGSPLRQEAARIAAAHSDAMGRASAALKLVQQQVRYVYVGFNGGNMTPASADETWQRRYGDCKGKSAVLLALLAELGIPAEAVLASNAGTDDGLDQRLPNPASFDHVLVRATIDGQVAWLDGTLPPVYPPSQVASLPYRWVLPLSAAGSTIEPVKWRPETRPDELTMFELDARAGFSEPAQIRNITIKRGPAAILDYFNYSSLTDDQLLTATRQGLEGDSTWNSIDRVTWRFDAKSLASVFEITGRGPLDWDDDGKGSRSMSLPGGGFSPPGRRQRGSEQDQSAPYYIKPEFDCRVTTVRLPAKTAEKDWSFNAAYDTALFGQTFRRSFERRDGAIRMIRSNRTLQTEIDSLSAAKDNARLAKFDNSMAWIYYDPASSDRIGSGETVPATYEIDWLADDSACLTPQRRGK